VLAFGLSKSHLYYPTQLAFVGCNVLGIACSIMYNMRTPDLYPNNVHHKIGWMIMGLLTVHTVMGVLWMRPPGPVGTVGSMRKLGSSYTPLYSCADEEELDDLVVSPRRTSGDSGLGAERPSSPSEHLAALGHDCGYHRERGPDFFYRVTGLMRVGSFLQCHVPCIFTPSVVRVGGVLSSLIMHLLPIIGFVQVTAGLVVVTGIFVSYPEGMYSEYIGKSNGWVFRLEVVFLTGLRIPLKVVYFFGMAF